MERVTGVSAVICVDSKTKEPGTVCYLKFRKKKEGKWEKKVRSVNTITGELPKGYLPTKSGFFSGHSIAIDEGRQNTIQFEKPVTVVIDKDPFLTGMKKLTIKIPNGRRRK